MNKLTKLTNYFNYEENQIIPGTCNVCCSYSRKRTGEFRC